MQHQIDPKVLDGLLKQAQQMEKVLPEKMAINPDNAAKSLVQLVLGLVDLLRELMERQALRRIEGGSLSEEEIERIGLTFMRLDEQMQQLKDHFGLTDDDLKIDLGPLGKTH